MESQPVSERQIKLCHHFCLQAANRAADVVGWNREELVDHQLGEYQGSSALLGSEAQLLLQALKFFAVLISNELGA